MSPLESEVRRLRVRVGRLDPRRGPWPAVSDLVSMGILRVVPGVGWAAGPRLREFREVASPEERAKLDEILALLDEDTR